MCKAMTYYPLDLFFTREPGSLLSMAILWATREEGEAPTEASHVGAIVTTGELQEVECIEALRRVKVHGLWDRYHGRGSELTIYRPVNLSARQQVRILDRLHSRVGQRYGYAKLLLHLLRKLTGDPDWLRLSFLDRWPICSYLTAVEFEREGLTFGVEGRMATPDDMLDFCQAHPDKYRLVRPWAEI